MSGGTGTGQGRGLGALDAAKLAALTQGSERSAEGRLGLGLWITARILHTAGGRLRLAPPEAPLSTVLVAEFARSPAKTSSAPTPEAPTTSTT